MERWVAAKFTYELFASGFFFPFFFPLWIFFWNSGKIDCVNGGALWIL